MKKVVVSVLAGCSLLAFAQSGMAQDTDTATQDNGGVGIADGNEIVVSARRREEILQEVPQSVSAVSGATIQKLNITSLADVSQIVPGLTLSDGGASNSLRGVSFDVVSNTSPTIQFYMNDVPVGGFGESLRTLFDVGQIEVVRGPQGTLRGKSAPSGAITLTTRRPSLTETGGYVSGLLTEQGSYNIQAAVGTPIIEGILGLRLAASINSDISDVRSVNSPLKGYNNVDTFRATVRFEPSSNFDATIVYQHQQTKQRSFRQVFGVGGSTGLGPNSANPSISPEDRLGVGESPSEQSEAKHLITGQFNLRFGGQQLSYIAGARLTSGNPLSLSAQDVANAVPNSDYFSRTTGAAQEEMTHELRLSSVERVAGIFDYTIGGFYSKTTNEVFVQQPIGFLSGAFGPPPSAFPGAISDRYILSTLIDIDNRERELAVFGNLTAHLGDRTEIYVGGRYLHFTRNSSASVDLLPAFNAVNLGPTPCGLAGLINSPVYPGICDFAVAGRAISRLKPRQEDHPILYTASIKHEFSDDFMAYVSTGTAYRVGAFTIGVRQELDCCGGGNPDLRDLSEFIVIPSERSRSYEAGFKASFLDKRATLNVAVYRQNFKNFAFLTQPVRYLGVTDSNAPLTGSNVSVENFSFTAPVNARITGIDVEASFQVSQRFSISGGFAYAKSKITSGRVPCNDNDFDGIPNATDSSVGPDPTAQQFVDARVMVATCQITSGSISRVPNWTLNFQSEYIAPLSDKVDAFIRGNMTYYPSNSNQGEGVIINDHILANLYAGVRAPNGAWEASVFARAVNAPSTVLSRGTQMVNSGGSLSNNTSNYYDTSYTPRREVGFSLRYAFGSR